MHLRLFRLRPYWEAEVAKIITFDKGSKRRIRQIRWTRLEIGSAILLSLVLAFVCVVVLLLELSHGFDEPGATPQVKHAVLTRPLLSCVGVALLRKTVH